jgi:hypothetical protein
MVRDAILHLEHSVDGPELHRHFRDGGCRRKTCTCGRHPYYMILAVLAEHAYSGQCIGSCSRCVARALHSLLASLQCALGGMGRITFDIGEQKTLVFVKDTSHSASL